MARQQFDGSRDAAPERETQSASRQMCAAHGCPNRWSTESTKLCRWHSASPAVHWPTITREQQEAQTDQALANSNQQESPPTIMLTKADKVAMLQKLRRGFGQGDPRRWIHDLQARHNAGERLSTFQLDCLQNANAASVAPPEEVNSHDLGSAKRQAARAVAAYAASHPDGY